MYRLEHIEYLHILWAIPILVGAFAFYKSWQKKAQARWGDAELLQDMTTPRSTFKPWLKIFYLCMALFFLTIALSNPQIGTKTETVVRQGVDLVFALDVSASMLAEDISPNRLEKAKYIIAKSLDELGGDRVGIIAYAGKAYPLLPITTDYRAARMALQSATPDFIPTPGTALDQALDYSLTYFDVESPASKVLVILSDGEDHEENWQNQIEKLNALGIKVLTVGLGTEKGGPIPLKTGSQVVGFKKDAQGEVVITSLDADVLQELAQQTAGTYVLGNNTNATLNALEATLQGLTKATIEEQIFTDYDDQFQWFLALGIVFLILELLTTERKSDWLNTIGIK